MDGSVRPEGQSTSNASRLAEEPGAADQPAILPRTASLVQILGGAVGLGAYILLAGGIAEWARLSGAGLPASEALSAFEPIALFVSGFQTLLLAPLALIAIHTANEVAKSVDRSRQEPRLWTVATQATRWVVQVWIVFVAFSVSLVPAAVVVALLSIASGSSVGVAAVVVASTAAVCAMVYRGVLRPGRDLPATITHLPRAWSAVPFVVRCLFSGLSRAGVLSEAVVLVGTFASTGVLAVGWLRGAQLGPLDIPEPSAVTFVAAFVALVLTMTVVLLAAVGAVWLRVSVQQRPVGERTKSDEETSDERAKLMVSVVATMIVSAVVLPVSVGVILIAVLVVVILAEALDAGGRNLLARNIALALAFALGLMAHQAHTPQTFDRLELSVAPDGRHVSAPFRVALLGSRGDSYVVAACDRRPDTVLGRKLWKSDRPLLLRVQKRYTVDPEIVSRRYVFAQSKERSVVGVLAAMLDVGISPPVVSSTLFRPSRTTPHVCGGVDNSATNALKFVQSVAGATG